MDNDDSMSPIEGAYDRDPRVAEFYGFTRGNMVFSLAKDGTPIARRLQWPQEPAVATARSHQVSLPFNVSGLEAPPMMPTGLFGVTGITGSGKSSFVRALAEAMAPSVEVRRLLVVEPHDDGEEILNVPTYSSADSALVAAVAGEYVKKKKKPVLYVLDSLRAPLFETSGAAGSKGISMPFFAQITRVSNCLAKAGISVLFTINPMDEDKAYVDAFNQKLSASLPAMIRLDAGSSASRGFTGTLEMRPNRAPRSFSFMKPGATRVAIETVELEFDAAPTIPDNAALIKKLITATTNSPI